jgi:hypothetical protein
MTIDGSGIRIRTCQRAPLNALETPVIVLGGVKPEDGICKLSIRIHLFE